MDLAILEALKAGWRGEIPVGAVVVYNNQILFTSSNGGKFQHAEMLVCDFVTKNFIKNYDLYVNMEPCIMCWFALHQTGVKKIFFGCINLDYGGYSCQIHWKKKKKIEVFSGMREAQNQLLLKSFFYHKRS